jgi:DNA-binding transcriptional ArsR family regulator
MAARPANRRVPTLEPGGNPRVRDFSRASGPAIEWDVRTAYDFVFSLSDDAGSNDDLPAPDRAWLADAKADLRRRTGDALDLYGHELCIVLAGFAVDHPEVTDAASFMRFIDAADDRTVLRTIVGDDLRDPEIHETVERAIDGDATAIATMTERASAHHDPAFKAYVSAIYTDPASVIRPARQVLAEWLAPFRAVEPRVEAMIRRDFELRAEDRASLDLLELVERTTGGIRWLTEPGIRRLILAPSYFARPYNFLLGGPDWRLFGYPIADAALDATDPLAPPAAVVRLHRALGDETRLRILRLLRDKDLYLTEIAQALDLSKPTIKHHLALLRSAGLVTVTEAGSVIYYSLRPARLDDASSEIKHFLLG